ncbi:Bug family tripartite tricarboxylate transporter substrate binding protein [Pseudorhodoplanes sp.]|uniref:Bug family tripartite tricarboxylate transporter substrate binding protein n=1 Tax=Pseudorhodoplanes sp. TaxID=1934341 RepID=UPI003D0B69AF
MRRLSLFGLLVLLAAPPSAIAETWPSKSIKAVVPFGAGSATDIIPRIVFEQLQGQLGQSIVVENRGGAGGTIGAAQVVKSDPDGYTWLVHSSAHTVAPALYSNLPFKAETDLVPMSMIGSVPNVLIISPSKGIKTVQDFVAFGKANPGKLNFASVGIGSAVHLSAERFRVSAGYDAVHIPFKGGAEALAEVIAGRVDYYFCPIATALPHIREGKLLALAVSSKTRAAQLPDVPTTLEAGFPDSDYTLWVGILGPSGTPEAVTEKLNGEMKKALAAPALREKLDRIGVQTMPMSPDEFGALIRTELKTYGDFVKKAGRKVN